VNRVPPASAIHTKCDQSPRAESHARAASRHLDHAAILFTKISMG